MTGYPAYAHVLGLTIGTCTTAQLVRRLGRGVVQTGGHSDSGHSWTFRKAQLDTDGFNFVGDSRSPLIDQVVLSWSGELGKVREFKRFGMGILGKLRSGMSNAQVSAALAPLKLRSVSYGNLGITENRIIRIWKHRYNCLYVLFLEFERGGLNGMEMFADVDTDSNILKS
jgi:hypothetical protein